MRKILVAILSVFLFSASAAKHGLDLAGMDPSVHPGDDFFRYANGTWLQKTEIPPDRSSYGSFSILNERADKRTAALIEEAAQSKAGDGRKVGDFYAAFMDEAAIERKGAAPLQPELNEIASLADKTALARYLGSGLRADVDPLNNTNFHTDRLFGLWVSPNFDDPVRNAGYLLQGGLGMPDRDNYLGTDPRDVDLQQKYRDHITAVLQLGGISDAASRAAKIYDLEHKIAEAHVSRTDSSDVLKANNRWPLVAFTAKAPGLDWPVYFESAGLAKERSLFVWQPSAVTAIAALVASEPLDLWKDYLAFHAIDRASGVLSKAFVDERFKFYGTAMTGATKLRDRWKRAVSATNGALGEAVGQLYVKRYFPPAAKTEAQQMVKSIIAAFRTRIDRLDWMSPATREKAKAKLSTLYVGIGYPDRWRDYSGLEVRRDDAYGNAQRSELFDYQRSLAKLGKPVDKTEWWMTPQTVNAVNLPLQNALNFPAAILDPPFFDPKTEAVQNYGGIGTVIGHEISHSFDDQGSQFDAQGRLNNWWTPEDFAHFRTAADRLARQYDAYEPLPGAHVNGALTLGENIADLAGMSASYDGYRAAYAGKAGTKTDRTFFTSFGQIWRNKMRPEALRNSLMTNGHAPSEFRADMVRNIDAWYKAFDVKPERKLYLAPADRVRVW